MENEQEVTEEQQVNVETFEVDTIENEQEVTEEQVNFETSEVGTMENEQEVTEEQNLANEEDDIYINNITLLEQEQTAASIKPSYSNSYCQMRCETSIIDYTWKLDRCPFLFKLVTTLFSSPFPETAKYKIKMEVSIEPEWTQSLIKFYLVTEESFSGTCDVCMIKINGKEIINSSPNSIWGIMSNMKLLYETTVKKVCEYLYRDMFTINFTFEIFHHSFTDVLHVKSLALSRVFPTNFKSRNLTLDPCDMITFIINGKRYDMFKKLLHNTKCVEYFCSTYKENMANSNIITINDDKNMEAVFKIMLSYIKTGCLSPKQLHSGTAKTLLEVASRCDLQDLKLICEEYLIRIISIPSALELMKFAILSNAKHLEKHVASFIKFHSQDIIYTEEFQSLPQEQLDKIIKLVEKIETLETQHLFIP